MFGCKGSANRAKCQRKTCFSLYFRDAAYFRGNASKLLVSLHIPILFVDYLMDSYYFFSFMVLTSCYLCELFVYSEIIRKFAARNNIKIMTAIELRAELFREMSPLLDNESAMTKMLAFVKSLVPAKKVKSESDWANRFVGAWKDSRSAEEIISDIRESRTVNSRDIEL